MRALQIVLDPSEAYPVRCDAGHQTRERVYSVIYNAQRGGEGSGVNLCGRHFIELGDAITARVKRDKTSSSKGHATR